MNRKQRRAQDKTRQPASPAEATDTRDPIALHAAGVQAFRAGHLEAAAELIAKAIAANGHMPDFHYNLAIVLRAQSKLNEAAASYKRAIALKPDYPEAHNNLGNVWKMLGQPDEARISFERALQCKPGNADTHYSLGILCSDCGDRDEAARHFQLCLDHDPDDSRGARMLLAHLGLEPAPEQAPQAQLLNIYDVRSRFWDQERSYFAHALVAEGLQKHAGRAKLDILDIGCGTGLVGAQVRHLAGKLDGVDISLAMLEKARDKEHYDSLVQSDLVSFMSGHRDSYDAILGAATLIHFGNLNGLFQAAAMCLRDSGLFVFTVFSHETDVSEEADDTDFTVAANAKLAQSGCYTHSVHYVERLARESGFSVQLLKKAVHEHDADGNPVPGLVVVLRRANRAAAPTTPNPGGRHD
jgi:predicted TPR repeat methyltransferase